MGPFELIDLIGLDVNLSIARSFFAQGGEPERWRPSPIQERLVEEGKLGRKSGQGYYAYGEESSARSTPSWGSWRRRSTPSSWPGSTPPPSEILSRLFAQIANEAAFALEEEIASPQDMETAMQLGLNWPLGPLGARRADRRRPGAVALLEELERERRRLRRGAAAAAPASADRRGELPELTRRGGTSARPGSTSSSPRPARPSG